jgi:hypothetical protein
MARILESEGGRDEWDEHDTYQGITDTAETYDEYEASQFAVSETYADDSDDSDGGLSADKRASIQTALTLALGEDHTYQEAAEAVGYSSAWVSDRVSEYRAGDYSEWLDLDSDE